MYQYLDRDPVPGDIVEYVKHSTSSIKKGSLSIVTEVEDFVKTTFMGECTGLGLRNIKVVKTKPGSEAQVGDTVMSLTSIPYVRKPGDIFTVLELAEEGFWYKEYTTSSPDEFKVLCKAEPEESTPIPSEIPLESPTPCTLESTQQQKESSMKKLDLPLLIALLTSKPETKDATNSNYVAILTDEDGDYDGYIYFDDKDEAISIMQKAENEGKKLHIFSYEETLAQKPRKVISVGRD